MTTPTRATISPEARAQIRAETAIGGRDFEHLFCATWDEARQSITAVRLIMRGTRTMVTIPAQCFPPGSVCLHTHPTGSRIEPSADDVTAAHQMALLGCGSALCDQTGDALFLICTPQMIRPFAPPAPDRKTIFKAGRFSLFHWTEQRFFQIILTH